MAIEGDSWIPSKKSFLERNIWNKKIRQCNVVVIYCAINEWLLVQILPLPFTMLTRLCSITGSRWLLDLKSKIDSICDMPLLRNWYWIIFDDNICFLQACPRSSKKNATMQIRRNLIKLPQSYSRYYHIYLWKKMLIWQIYLFLVTKLQNFF